MFLISSFILIGSIVFLYIIHDYLYLPDETFHAIRVHLFGSNIESSDYKAVYDSIHFLSWHSLKFAIIWSTIIFAMIYVLVEYIKFIKHFKASKRMRVIKISISFLLSIIMYFDTVISNFTEKELYWFKRYFTFPFTNDLTSYAKSYDNLSDLFHHQIFWWSWTALEKSIVFFLVYLILIYIFFWMLSKISKLYKEIVHEYEYVKEYPLQEKRCVVREVQSDTPSENTQHIREQKNIILHSQEEQIDLNNEVTFVEETIDSLKLIDTRKNNVILDENIDSIASETPIALTIKPVHKTEVKKGVHKLRMVHKVGENHTSI